MLPVLLLFFLPSFLALDCPQGELFFYVPDGESLTSPNWPNNYPDNFDCTYYFEAPINTVIQFTFSSFNTEDCCDKVFAYDGPSNSTSAFKTVSGTANGNVIRSSGRLLTLRFVTDAIVTRAGFSAIARALPPTAPTASQPPPILSSTTPSGSTLSCKRDFAFLFDVSINMQSSNAVNQELAFLDLLTSGWRFGGDAANAFLLSYTSLSASNLPFTDERSIWEEDLRYFEDSLSLDAAGVTLAVTVARRDLLNTQGRPDVPRVTLLFTSSSDSKDFSNAASPASLLRQNGDRLVVIGLQADNSLTTLASIASGTNFAFKASDYGGYTSTLVSALHAVLCL